MNNATMIIKNGNTAKQFMHYRGNSDGTFTIKFEFMNFSENNGILLFYDEKDLLVFLCNKGEWVSLHNE